MILAKISLKNSVSIKLRFRTLNFGKRGVTSHEASPAGSLFLGWRGLPAESLFPAKYINREYVVGEIYPMLVPVEERSQAGHNHYSLRLAEGFNNLSEENAKRFPSVEHLRHWALVQCGYATETNFVLANSKEARKLAADIRKRDPYAVIVISKDDRLNDSNASVVKVFDAESQSMAAMKKEKFQASKEDVLSLVASMSRTTPAQLYKEGRRHGR